MNTATSSTSFHAPDTPTVLLDIAQAVSSTLDLKELLKIIAQHTAAACGADVCSIFLCERQVSGWCRCLSRLSIVE